MSAYTFIQFTNWCTGVLNGYRHKEQGLPNSIVYSVVGTSTVITMAKVMGSIDPPLTSTSARQTMVGVFLGAPVVTGLTYFLGNQMGQAVRFVEDERR